MNSKTASEGGGVEVGSRAHKVSKNLDYRKYSRFSNWDKIKAGRFCLLIINFQKTR